MTITFENDKDVIIYAIEKIISFARENQYFFVANCAWWLARVIDLDSGLTLFIDNHRKHKTPKVSGDCSETVHPDRVQQIVTESAISSTKRYLTEDQRLDQILVSASECSARSERDQNTWQRNRVNPLPPTKTQLKKARKIKCLQEANKKEVQRKKRLQEIRRTVIQNISRK
jgi:hypothetical protein